MEDLLTSENVNPLLAQKRIRFLAIFIDYVLVFAFSIFICVNYGDKTYDPVRNSYSYQLTGYPALGCFIFWLLIIPVLEYVKTQTIGKMICKIKVVQVDYENPTIKQCLVRHLFDIVDYLPFFGIVGLLVSSNNPLKQRVGDLVVKTIVIQKPTFHPLS